MYCLVRDVIGALCGVFLSASATQAQLASLLGLESYATAVAVHTDGSIAVAIHSSYSRFAVARYHADGAPDRTFGGDGVVLTTLGSGFETPYDLAIQTDGKIVASALLDDEFRLVRYLSDGSLDPDFGIGGIVTTAVSIEPIAIQDDGKILAAGSALLRFNEDGTPDAAFGSGGSASLGIDARAWDVAIAPDGDIVVVSSGPMPIARFHPDGSLDGTFHASSDSRLTDGRPGGVAVQPDDKVVVKYGLESEGVIARYNPDGTFDTTFAADGVLNPPGYSGSGGRDLIIQPDGRIVAPYGGGLTADRWNGDGTVDTTFGVSGISSTDAGGGDMAYGEFTAMALQADGKLVGAGSWHHGGNTTTAVVRVNTDGSPDATFDGEGSLVESDCLHVISDWASCYLAGDTVLKIRRPRDSLTWTWKKGEPFDHSELGTPTIDNRFTLCVYEEISGVERLKTWFDAYGGYDEATRWTDFDPRGWSFHAAQGFNPDEVRNLRMRPSPTESDAMFKASSSYGVAAIPPPVSDTSYFDESAILTVRLVGANGFCATSQYSVAGADINQHDSFKARTRP
ncbi:MAG TPA: hypothetical protein VN634_08120 [Candidatus Limnocylindrales bacterium]|nr:hypothetical protein [Candidatus Limnocylindrales bacterium]